MKEEFNYRRNKMDSMISSYQNKINKSNNKLKILEYNEDADQDFDFDKSQHNLSHTVVQVAEGSGTIKIHTTKAQNFTEKTVKLTIQDNSEPSQINNIILDEPNIASEHSSNITTNELIEYTHKDNESDLKEQTRTSQLEMEAVDSPNLPIKPKKKKNNKIVEKDKNQTDLKTYPITSTIGDIEAPSYEVVDPNNIKMAEIEDVASFVFRPIQKSTITFKCQITRDVNGFDRALYPVYVLYHENVNGKKLFLLAARKRKKTTKNNYVISVDPVNLQKDDVSNIGKLKANLMCTKFSFFGTEGTQFATINYEYNLLGLNGPRKIQATIPTVLKHTDINNPPVVERFINKFPVWSEEYRSYILNFHGRVNQASIKNFQLIRPDEPDDVILQFGKVSANKFSLDFMHPFTPVQAFSVALSSFASKITRE